MLKKFFIYSSRRRTNSLSFYEFSESNEQCFSFKKISFSNCSNKFNYSTKSKDLIKLNQPIYLSNYLASKFLKQEKFHFRSLQFLNRIDYSFDQIKLKIINFSINYNQKFNLINLINNLHFQFLKKIKKQQFFKKNKMAPNNSTNQLPLQKTVKQDNNEIICKFGVITDAQYCTIDNRPAWYNKNKTRYYRDALTHLKKAFDNWNSMDRAPTFVLQLGDLIDGLNNNEIGCNSLDALEETLKIFSKYSSLPCYHAVGNHELYNFSRSEIALLFRESLINRGRLNPDLVHLQLDFHDLDDENTLLYYKFQPSDGIKIIALDCFDISVIGHHQESQKYQEAAEILYKNNHTNFDLWDFDNHLEGLNKRFQTQNGGFSQNQLNWLRNELKESEKNNEKVIVFGHTGLHPESSDPSCLAYNYDEVLEIFNEVNCVIAYLSGHAHKSGYAKDKNGIHYIVLHGIIETNPALDAYSTITVTKNWLIVDGKGSEQSLCLRISPIKIDDNNNESNQSEQENGLDESSENNESSINEKSDKYSEYEEQLPASSVVSVSV